MRPIRILPLLLSYILVAAGCTHAISRQGRENISREASFGEVESNPEQYRGKTLLLGGLILDLKVDGGHSTLEIQRWKLDRWGEPFAVDEEERHFLVRTEGALDPFLYAPGRLVTLTASVIGGEAISRLGNEYRYPLFHLDESYVWDTPFRYEIHPNPNIYVPYYVGPELPGRTSPYDPGYYAYPYTPYWLRSLAK